MSKSVLIFNKDDCMGCHACEVACKQEHNLGVGPRLVRVVESSPDFTPVYCRHCSKAPCLDVCPTGAIFKDDRGAVLINKDECIGCRECIDACPFSAMQFDEGSELAVKCDMCPDLTADNKLPACASICPTGCIFYGDLKERLALMNKTV